MKKGFAFLIGIVMCLSLCSCENKAKDPFDEYKEAHESYQKAQEELERLQDELELVRWKIRLLEGNDP